MRDFRALEPVTAVVTGVLLLVLLLVAAMFAFVGMINAEDWFFGTKLDGSPASLYLIVKAVGALVLACLIIRYAHRTRLTGVMTAAYLGYLFIDSSVTIRMTTGGARQFSEVLLVLFAISILFVIFQAIAPLRHPVAEGGATRANPPDL
ncbi:MAG TPA: hypothetical protein HA263_10530 [Methanoregulaceae archaeon]|nr:hypothetical protein [Methanoregulaceae archaeon]